MEERINVAELLKDCPKGMELDCAMFNNAYLERVDENVEYPIVIKVGKTDVQRLTKEGCWNKYSNAKCVIFPKGKTTWEGFQRPFKDGDVVSYLDAISIFKEWGDNTLFRTYVTVYLNVDSTIDVAIPLFGKSIRKEARLATEEEKQKLFDTIKENGYKWNSETKTLEKIEPKFKDGDIITDSLGTCIFKGEGEGDFEGYVNFYCGISNGRFCVKDEKRNPNGHYGLIVNYRQSTEEEKQKLFQAIKDNGYKWNSETKSLEKLITPKFKVGDVIQDKDSYKVKITDVCVEDKMYGYESVIVKGIGGIGFDRQDEWELVPDKFDINSLVPFESRVLVRDTEADIWKPAIFGCCIVIGRFTSYYVLGGTRWAYCIPYEGNQHLIGKTDICDDFYKNWE